MTTAAAPAAAPLPAPARWRACLVLFALAAFADESLVHYPVALMSLVGLVELARRPRDLLDSSAGRLLLTLFAALWLPMLLAWPGAVDAARSGETVLLYLHFLPAAWFVLRTCSDDGNRALVGTGAALLVLFVGFDALVQLVFDVDLFGYPRERGMLKGVFHPKQRLGLFLAVFAPLAVDFVRRLGHRLPGAWLLLVPALVAVLMSLKRSAWVMLVLGLVLYATLLWRQRALVPTRGRLLVLAALLGLAAATLGTNPALQQRLAGSAGLFSLDIHTMDVASGYRITLWRTGAAMFAEHPLTGIGPRSYRAAYRDYAAPGDFWVARTGRGQTHPHLLLLEVAVESGLVGLAGFIYAYLRLLAALRHPQRGHAQPVWLLGLLVAWFPFNTHLAFYGSYWSTLGWLLLALALAERAPAGSPSAGPA